MTAMYVLLIDSKERLIAIARLTDTPAKHREGKILFSNFPEEMLRAFRKYEEIVTTQQFAFLDEAEAAIQAFGISAWLLPEERAVAIEDLQVMNETDVSFRVRA